MWIGKAWRALALAAALGATVAVQSKLPVRVLGESGAQGEVLAPRSQAGSSVTLGFDSLLADYYWLRALQVVGGEPRDMERHVPALTRLTQTVVGLDPWVDYPYRFAALWLATSPESVRAGNRMLERGIAYHPTEWRNRFYLSFNHLFYLGDNEAAARELEQAVGLPGAPPYLGRLLARLRSESGGLEVAEAYLLELLKQTDDASRRKGYELALEEIETERRARRLDAARNAYRERHGRDIGRVEDLVSGAGAVLRALPPVPDGSEWILEPRTNEIVSSRLRRRYQVSVHPTDRARREAWAKQTGARQGASAEGS